MSKLLTQYTINVLLENTFSIDNTYQYNYMHYTVNKDSGQLQYDRKHCCEIINIIIFSVHIIALRTNGNV